MTKLNARCNRILELLARNGEVSVSVLSEQLKVTSMTIRRDLEYMESRNMLVRTHGGAVVTRPAVVEFAFVERSRTQMKEKRAIGQACVQFVKPGMHIVLDTGTTTLEAAKAIASVADLIVLTSSLPIAAALYNHESISVILLGGSVRKIDPNLSGPLTEDNLKRFHADLAILGADAVSQEGLFTTDLEVARVSRCMIDASEKKILVADCSKLRRKSFVRFAGCEEIDHFITDSGLSPDERAWLSEATRDLQVAEV